MVSGKLTELEVYIPSISCSDQKMTTKRPEKEIWKKGKKKKPRYVEAPKELPYVPITAIDSPKWGGKCKIHNKHITLTNTCSLDNKLYILVTLFDNKNIENFSHYKIIKLLNEMLEYSRNGDWDSAKAIYG